MDETKTVMPKDVSWVEALSKYFARIGFCVHLEILRATPAIEFKKQAMDSVIKKLKALDK